MNMQLSALQEQLGGRLFGAEGAGCATNRLQILDVKLDSRRVGVGDLFVALPGKTADGARFLTDAAARGAVAVLTPHELDLRTVHYDMPGLHIVQWTHPDARLIAGRAAALVQGRPADHLTLAGITGTNGKTTTAHILGGLLERAGMHPAILGTAGHRLAGGRTLSASHTTPDAPELQRLLRRHVDAHGQSAVMEVSSHALAQERTSGIDFDLALFTNLTREHLDYHGDMAAYAAAKARLFAQLAPSSTAILNKDDPAWEIMAEAARKAGARVITYSARVQADLCARLRIDPQGLQIEIDGMGIMSTGLRLPLRGRYNVENALAAAAAALVMGVAPSDVVEGLAVTRGAPGRMEEIGAEGGAAGISKRGFRVYVDYAHSPDALERVLRVLRQDVDSAPRHGRVIVVFGCGGDRDKGKRPVMGRVAAELADICLLTSDNPRGEEPEEILADILSGIDGPSGIDGTPDDREGSGASELAEVAGGNRRRAKVSVQVDRRTAIEEAIACAQPGDIVLIAGKGHETRQVVGDEVIVFDDRLVASEALA